MPTGLENCYTATVIDDTDNRTVDYDLMMDEMEKCDNITEGWYRFQDLKNILNYPPSIGQCSSRAPIWLEGNTILILLCLHYYRLLSFQINQSD